MIKPKTPRIRVLQRSPVGGDPCAEMQSNYGYDISSSEEEGVPSQNTRARPKIKAHHSNHKNHSSDDRPSNGS